MTIIDLHDIASILLREYMFLEMCFRHSRLQEINDRSRPRIALPHFAQTICHTTDLLLATSFLTMGRLIKTPIVDLSSFKRPDFVNNFSVKQIDWRHKDYDSSACHANRSRQSPFCPTPHSHITRVRPHHSHHCRGGHSYAFYHLYVLNGRTSLPPILV
jgi:hypothetical protein